MIQSLLLKNNQDVTQEDPRTSTIFDALLHLPDNLLWEILRGACHDNHVLPTVVGKLEFYAFWPKWDAGGTENERYVEPDVYLQFAEANLIIEAKRSDGGGQYYEEWERELTAYENTHDHTDVPVFLIAMGGIGNIISRETIAINEKERMIVKCSWAKLHEVLLEKSQELVGNERRIIESLVNACALFGFRNYKWLASRMWILDFKMAIPADYRSLIFRR